MNNTIFISKDSEGFDQYVIDIGYILYNDRVLNLNNIVIPLFTQKFFNLPQDKAKYAIINVYYEVETGNFVFDKLGEFDKSLKYYDAPSLSNLLPIAQFTIKEKLGSFIVINVNEYSRMATFTITDTFVTGSQGGQGPQGYTGPQGDTGLQGITGNIGLTGTTLQGDTGVGSIGVSGPQGTTGANLVSNGLLYFKFKTEGPTILDYSGNEKDCYWGESGGNSFVGISGIVDGAFSIMHDGGFSSFNRNEYLDIGMTGTISAFVRFDVVPNPSFTYIDGGVNPLIINFSDTSTNFPSSWVWDFGDGVTNTHQNVTYMYGETGVYLVTFTVCNDCGCAYTSQYITV